jgi:hypothetical protein
MTFGGRRSAITTMIYLKFDDNGFVVLNKLFCSVCAAAFIVDYEGFCYGCTNKLGCSTQDHLLCKLTFYENAESTSCA